MREKKLENEELDLFEYAREKGRLTDDEKAYIIAQQLELTKRTPENAHLWSPTHRWTLPEVLALLTPAERLEGMSLKEILTVLTPQDIVAILGMEKFEELLRQDREQQIQAAEDKPEQK